MWHSNVTVRIMLQAEKTKQLNPSNRGLQSILNYHPVTVSATCCNRVYSLGRRMQFSIVFIKSQEALFWKETSSVSAIKSEW